MCLIRLVGNTFGGKKAGSLTLREHGSDISYLFYLFVHSTVAVIFVSEYNII